MDFNSHVGNVNYAKWVIDSMPLEIVQHYRIHELNIKYEKQIKDQGSIILQTQIEEKEDKIYANHIIIDKNNNALSLLERYWEKIK